MKDELLFLPLGGSGEIGMNLNLYKYGGKWIMVDCGISFADNYLPGIDLIMPEISYISDRRDDLLGLLVTHAHEDHLGAVAHLWPELQCPVYATPFTMILLRAKLAEAGILNDVPLIEVPLEGHVSLGSFEVDYVSLTHSIPEANALTIKTPAGTIFHTGDWKLDPDPLVGEATSAKKMKAIGDGGVLALVCDSTNVFNLDASGSEKTVRDNLTQIMQGKSGKIFITTFASNVARVETIARVAQATGRHLCLIGASLKRNVAAAKATGYLADFPLILDEEDASHIPGNKILYACTGCQGEARAAMMRIALDNHKYIHFTKGDTVVFSSKIIPGNEMTLARLHNILAEKSVEVITEKDAFVHVSGHPGQKELREMYDWIRPEIAVPVHGEIRHLKHQAAFASSIGVEQVVVPHNGSLIRLAPGPAAIIEKISTGRLALDGKFIISTEDDAIVIRRRIQYNGAVVVHLVVDGDNRLQSPPNVTALGLPDGGGMEAVICEAIVRKMPDFTRLNDRALGEKVRVIARKSSKNHTAKETGPVTTVNITRII